MRSMQGTCLRPYLDLDENCKPVRDSGIKIGTGIDLKFRTANHLKDILPESLLSKLEPILNKYEGLINVIKNNPINLTV